MNATATASGTNRMSGVQAQLRARQSAPRLPARSLCCDEPHKHQLGGIRAGELVCSGCGDPPCALEPSLPVFLAG